MPKLLRRYGELDTKLKNKVCKSFRFEIIVYSLLSLLYSVLTVSAILFAIVLLYVSVGTAHSDSKEQKEYSMEEYSLGEEGKRENIRSYAINNAINNNLFKQEAERKKYEADKEYREEKMLMVAAMAFAILLGIVFFILYFLKLTQKFGLYMETIACGITELSHGNFSSRIMVDSEDEFAIIADKINEMAKDIEELMTNQKKSERTKNGLITSVAHDLRTPLTSIIGYLDLVSKRELDADTWKKYIEVAYSKSKRLEQLIEDLFSYTKCNEKDMILQYTTVDIVKLVEQLLEEFYPSFEEHHLEYDFIKDCTTLDIKADGNLLARAFANLIGNAIKYGADGKRVELQLKRGINSVYLTVRNFGEIISSKDLDYIFDRFYRVDCSRTQEMGGSGLGLAIAKSIIQMHHGSICAKSNFDGTVFEVTLPITR